MARHPHPTTSGDPLQSGEAEARTGATGAPGERAGDPPASRFPARDTLRRFGSPRSAAARLGRVARPFGLLLAPTITAFALLGAFAPDAFGFFTPESGGSPNADSIDFVYKIVFYISILVFVVVEGGLLVAIVKYRARKHPVPIRTHGNTALEAGWTIGAVVIVIALATLTLIKLPSIQDPQNSDPSGAKLVGESGVLYASNEQKLPPNKKALEIEVIGHQFIWQYVYPGAEEKDGLGAPYSYQEMVVPTHTTVLLNIVSDDVVHSWWVPQLGGKFQAVPGYHSYAWFKIDKPGRYRGQCANICGRGHARMTASVRAIPPAQFESWLEHRKEEIHEANVKAAAERATLESKTGPASVVVEP